MLEVGDKSHYKKLKGRTLSSVYRFSKSQWDCILRGGSLLQIRFKTGVLGMTVAKTEYGLGQEIMLVGLDEDWKENEFSKESLEGMENDEIMDVLLTKALSKNLAKKKPRALRTILSFSEIMEFMDWKCKEENIWDSYVG